MKHERKITGLPLGDFSFGAQHFPRSGLGNSKRPDLGDGVTKPALMIESGEMKKLCNLKDTVKCAGEVAVALLSGGPSKRATVIGLKGDLGSGKTAFTKALAKKLGVTETVLSPTFVIMKTYNLQPTTYNLKKLIHIDAYRLESEKELRSLGWDEILAEPKNLIVIEWPERVKKLLPKDTREIKFKFIDDKTRGIEWK